MPSRRAWCSWCGWSPRPRRRATARTWSGRAGRGARSPRRPCWGPPSARPARHRWPGRTPPPPAARSGRQPRRARPRGSTGWHKGSTPAPTPSPIWCRPGRPRGSAGCPGATGWHPRGRDQGKRCARVRVAARDVVLDEQQVDGIVDRIGVIECRHSLRGAGDVTHVGLSVPTRGASRWDGLSGPLRYSSGFVVRRRAAPPTDHPPASHGMRRLMHLSRGAGTIAIASAIVRQL